MICIDMGAINKVDHDRGSRGPGLTLSHVSCDDALVALRVEINVKGD